MRFLTALPVFNEATHVDRVLDEVVRYSGDVLVVDDGSTDGTDRLLAARGDVSTVRHAKNTGYGAALRTAFEYAVVHRYDALVTIDCDGQHQPQRIPQFAAAPNRPTSSPAAATCRPSTATAAPPNSGGGSTSL